MQKLEDSEACLPGCHRQPLLERGDIFNVFVLSYGCNIACSLFFDRRFVRALQLGIPAIGFTPIINTPVLPHDNDEYLSVDAYLSGIEIYKRILQEVTEA